MKKNKVDWDKIKNEYITTSISYKKIAKKYSVPFETLRYHAKKESWYEEKKKYQHSVNIKSTQKREKLADEKAEDLLDLDQEILAAEKLVIMECTSSIMSLDTQGDDYHKKMYTTQKTLESALNTIHKIKYPPDRDNNTKQINFIVSDKLKECGN